MKLLLEVKNEKAPFILELLKNFRFVKTRPLKELSSPGKKEILEGLKQSVEEVKLHKAGKIKLQTAKELLDEL